MSFYTVDMVIDGLTLSITGILANNAAEAIEKARHDAKHSMGYGNPKKLKARLERVGN